MGGDRAVAAAVVAGVVAVAVVMLRRWRRTASARRRERAQNAGTRSVAMGDVWLIVAGLVLVMGGLTGGLRVLRIDDPPTQTAENIGFVPPLIPELGRGFALGMGVTTNGCDNPVKVKLVVAGTAEYWRDHGSWMPARARFRVAVPDTHLRNVKLGLGTAATDVTGAAYAETASRPSGLTAREPRRAFEVTVLEGSVRGWQRGLEPVVATFEADWLRPRGLGTCYLVLPGLVGSDSVSPAEQALGRASYRANHDFGPRFELVSTDPHTNLVTPIEAELEPTNGNTVVVVDGGQVVPESSMPVPDRDFDGFPRWTCKSTPRTYGDLDGSGPLAPLSTSASSYVGGAFSKRGIENEYAGNCAGVAVIAEKGAAVRRDLVLILMGAVISLGAAIVVEVLLDWRRSGTHC